MPKHPRSYTNHTHNLLAYRERLLEQHNEIEGSKHPVASLARKMYRQDPIREPDSTRAFVSPLGGQATVQQTNKEKR